MATRPMTGRRVQADKNGWFSGVLKPGDYVRVAPERNQDGSEPTPEQRAKNWPAPYWLGCTPNGHVCNLINHEVRVNADDTITVSPSILVGDRHNPLWHGFLIDGVWREPNEEGK